MPDHDEARPSVWCGAIGMVAGLGALVCGSEALTVVVTRVWDGLQYPLTLLGAVYLGVAWLALRTSRILYEEGR